VKTDATESAMTDPHTAPFWRQRAEEARKRAASMRDPDSKRYMLGIARSYDLLALRAEERAKGPSLTG
jgi:hypothetical protein